MDGPYVFHTYTLINQYPIESPCHLLQVEGRSKFQSLGKDCKERKNTRDRE